MYANASFGVQLQMQKKRAKKKKGFSKMIVKGITTIIRNKFFLNKLFIFICNNTKVAPLGCITKKINKKIIKKKKI